MQGTNRPESSSEDGRIVRAEFLIEPFVEGSPALT